MIYYVPTVVFMGKRSRLERNKRMAGGAMEAWPPSDLKGCHECSGEQNKNFHVVCARRQNMQQYTVSLKGEEIGLKTLGFPSVATYFK